MDLEIVFNELCLRTPASDVQTARQWMSKLIIILQTVRSHNESIKFRTRNDFYQSELAPDYSVSKWFKEQGKDLEALRLKSLIRQGWPLNDIIDPEIDIRYQLEDGKLEQAIGLAYSFIFNALAVSFNSSPQWDCSRVQVKVHHIDEDEELTEDVIHASCSIHVGEHADWIKNSIREKVLDGIDLWQRKENLFPHLLFCDSVEKQLQNLLADDLMLRSVEERLFQLEDASKNWTSGAFDLKILPCKASPESETRLQQLEKQLTFKCPDGVKRVFSLHVRMTPGAWRLHFSTESGPGKIIIGYIGLKIQ